MTLSWSLLANSYPEQPPPAHSGAPGEPDCASCHFGGDSEGATLTLEGLPARYAPGQRYALAVVIASPALRKGGFQLSARQADGSQAGLLDAASDDASIQELDSVAYLGHAPAARIDKSAGGTVTWTLHWTAPQTDEVTFHLTAVAGNDDESPLGDTVLRYSVRLLAHGS